MARFVLDGVGGGFEGIPNTSNGVNDARTGCMVQSLADSPNVNVDRSSLHVHPMSPDGFVKLFPRKYLTGIRHQVLQNSELSWTEMYWLPLPARPMRNEIDK